MLERALAEVYKPLLTYIYKNSALKIHLYLPGPTYEWFELNHPEMNMLIGDLVKKEQLELLTGSYQQALLHTVQGKDRSGQLEATTTLIRKRFGKRSRSAWFFNQIWTPTFVSAMHMGMLERLVISGYDRLHDLHVALEPFVMQELGRTIEVFVTNDAVNTLVDELRQGEVDFKEFEERLEALSFDSSNIYQTLMIDLDSLLQASALQPNLPSAIELFTTIFEICQTKIGKESELLSSIPVGTIKERGYLPASWYGRDSSIVDINSFNEMLLKYKELNHLYGRLLYLVNLNRIFRKNKDIKKRLDVLLLKAASGGAFVLDSSAGCYRRNYRSYVYRHLNEAEKLLNQYEEIPYPREVDLDFDGYDELIWVGKTLGIVFDRLGASLSEINFLPTGWNYGNTFSGYAGEVNRLSFHALSDGSFQRSFSDVFLPANSKLEEYAKGQGRAVFDTAEELYTVEVDQKNQNELLAKRLFSALPFNLGDIEVTKHFIFRSQTIVVTFKLHNRGKRSVKGQFGSELNLAIGLKEGPLSFYTIEKNRNRRLVEGRMVGPNLKNVRSSDDLNRTIISIASDNRFNLFKDDFWVKLPTVMGMEELYSHTLLLPVWEFNLEADESVSWTLAFRIERRARRPHQKEKS
ncbi:MAG: alpha-amylase/4-alpha-glucanotransferase domain-containing protein [Sphaerochaetaceae bacterium]